MITKNESLADRIEALLREHALSEREATLLRFAASVARQQPDLRDPLPFRNTIRQVSLLFRKLYGEQASDQAHRVAEATGKSALARMIVNDLVWTERAEAREAALAEYNILDTAAEPGFDDIVLIASHVCQTPIALVSLVESHRQWFKARVGIALTEVAIDDSVCIHAMDEDRLLVIPDMSVDVRTRDNPYVQGPAPLRFYATAPLVTPAGVTIGGLCVVDYLARPTGLTSVQATILQALARQAVVQLELRRLTGRDEAGGPQIMQGGSSVPS